jgi:hypothetical protein
MKVITNNKNVAIEVLSAQDLFSFNINEITIKSIGNSKHCLNDYDAKVTIHGMEFILYRDLNFQNVKIKNILNADLSKVEFIEL